MSPRRIVRRAVELGLDLLGICDHNACGNVPALRGAAKDAPLAILGGMEITSQEEVHLLAYFDDDGDLFAVQKELHAHLEDAGDDRWRDEQVLASAEDEVEGFHPKLLIGAVQLSLEKLVEMIHGHGGLVVASHIDREGFGIIGQLGFIPPGLALDAVEMVDPAGPLRAGTNLPVMVSSDAHRLEDLGCRTTRFTLQAPTVGEIRQALRSTAGRRMEI